jgi:hypothetical protein
MAGSGKERIEKFFPNLAPADYTIESNESPSYNCVAWAAGDDTAWWEPVQPPQPGYYWPDGAPLTDTVDAVLAMFRLLRFEICTGAEPEVGYDKIAIYASEGHFNHVTRLLPSGKWASKLGPLEDIYHDTLECLSGDEYGTVTHIMRRPTAETSAPLPPNYPSSPPGDPPA